jgi:hypothetical protein
MSIFGAAAVASRTRSGPSVRGCPCVSWASRPRFAAFCHSCGGRNPGPSHHGGTASPARPSAATRICSRAKTQRAPRRHYRNALILGDLGVLARDISLWDFLVYVANHANHPARPAAATKTAIAERNEKRRKTGERQDDPAGSLPFFAFFRSFRLHSLVCVCSDWLRFDQDGSTSLFSASVRAHVVLLTAGAALAWPVTYGSAPAGAGTGTCPYHKTRPEACMFHRNRKRQKIFLLICRAPGGPAPARPCVSGASRPRFAACCHSCGGRNPGSSTTETPSTRRE